MIKKYTELVADKNHFVLVVCAVVSHPPDTIVSYMNKAKGSTFTSSAKALGFMGLWKGLVPRTIMIGTLTALQWFIYDVVKVGGVLTLDYFGSIKGHLFDF